MGTNYNYNTKINVNHRKLIGLVILHKSNSFNSLKDFLQGVCRKPTYYSIVRNTDAPYDKSYHKLISLSGEQYKKFNYIDVRLFSIINNFYSCVENLDIIKLENIKDEVEVLFNDAKSYIYYKEYYEVIITSLDFFIDNKFPMVELINKLEIIVDAFPIQLKILIHIILYTYYFDVKQDKDKSVKYINYFTKVENEDKLITYYKALNYMVNSDIPNLLTYYKLNQPITIINNADIKYVNLGFVLFTNVKDNNQCDKLIDLITNYLDSTNEFLIPKRLIIGSFYNIANYYLFNHNYSEAIVYYLKYLLLCDNDLLSLIVICIVLYLSQKVNYYLDYIEVDSFKEKCLDIISDKNDLLIIYQFFFCNQRLKKDYKKLIDVAKTLNNQLFIRLLEIIVTDYSMNNKSYQLFFYYHQIFKKKE